MSTQATLVVEKREGFGTGAARACRRAGKVPGIVYGEKKDSEGISVDPKTLFAEFQKPSFFTTVYTLDLAGKKEQVLVKDIQLHPVTDTPMHIDFMRVSKGTKIRVHVPINFINEDKAPALKRGGVLNIVHHTLEVSTPVDVVPESFTIDLSVLDLSKGIHISDLQMPAGVAAVHPERDNTLATVVMPKADKEGNAEEAGA